ncbi:MAG TPA: protein-disulfide reductase DsbD family protein, partial [Agitococcus sp.]|nr:protein-disulfide reductase DsbD family protein [Agitococcus sp.]
MMLFLTSLTRAEELKSFAGGASFSSSGNKTQFLKAEQAFMLQYEQKGQELILNFTIAPNYYLYKERFKFQVNNGNAILGQAYYSLEPEWKDDAEFGRVQVFHQSLSITMPVKGNGEILVRWQGCADAGLCYAPQEQLISLAGAPSSSPATLINNTTVNRESVSIPIPTLIPLVSYDIVEEETPVNENIITETPNSDNAKLITKNTATLILPSTTDSTTTIPTTTSTINNDFKLPENPMLALLTLFVLGLGLAFTPCVLPMLPIVANIVARQHASNARQGLFLGFAYAIGVASSYGLLGVLVSAFGSQVNLAAWLQHPSILISFSVLFIILALASFDVFHLQLPQSWQHRLDQLSKTGKAGSFIGTWLTGFFSALVVSPCVSAPLAGVLLSVSTL